MGYWGQSKIRQLWKYYYTGTKAVIYVVDSNDVKRIEESAEELQNMMKSDELREAALLILANKQDLPYAKSATELRDGLKLHQLKQKNWFIQPCTGRTGEGLFEGLEWLSQTLKKM